MSFYDRLRDVAWDDVHQRIQASRASDVERVLHKTHLGIDDFGVLLSPAAEAYLKPMAQRSRALTRKRFGRAMQLYVPVYLSNECHNICTYCGFSMQNKIPRKVLTPQEIDAEIVAVKAMGFDHVLLVTGEAPRQVGVEYLRDAIHQMRPHFSQLCLEVQPLDVAEYADLRQAGASAVYIYQETYHEATYREHHPKGRKSNFRYRLETPDRLGEAGIEKIGLGVLLGLEEWRVDSFLAGVHLDYLERTYWRTKYSISFPRLRPHAGGLTPKVELSDRQMVQLICAWRLFREEVELSLSTRESPVFRDGVMEYGVTSMSAASRTDPGGYAAVDGGSLEQFEISDDRSAADVAAAITRGGFQPVWKDWDMAYDQAR